MICCRAMAMLGSDVRDVFEKILPNEALSEIVEKTGFQQRERKSDALVLIRSMVLAASSGRGGRQAEVMEAYFAAGAPRMARSSFYRWFGDAFEKVMENFWSLIATVVTPPGPLMKSGTPSWRGTRSSCSPGTMVSRSQ